VKQQQFLSVNNLDVKKTSFSQCAMRENIIGIPIVSVTVMTPLIIVIVVVVVVMHFFIESSCCCSCCFVVLQAF
jgi:hypothetical protein